MTIVKTFELDIVLIEHFSSHAFIINEVALVATSLTK